MYTCMLKAHTALGEGPQAVALMKDMRAAGLPVAASACSLLVLAFCRAGALQVCPFANLAPGNWGLAGIDTLGMHVSTTVQHWTQGTNCPYCQGKRVCKHNSSCMCPS